MADFKYWLPEGTGAKEIKTFANSVIFIGANGAGKSRLGAWIERKDKDYVHRIGAQRSLNFQESIPLKSYKESEDFVMFGISDQPNKERKIFKYNSGNGSEDDKYVTHFFDDFTNVLSALIAKFNNENDKFIAECKEAEKQGKAHPHTPETDIDKLVTVWSDIFPAESDHLRRFEVLCRRSGQRKEGRIICHKDERWRANSSIFHCSGLGCSSE